MIGDLQIAESISEAHYKTASEHGYESIRHLMTISMLFFCGGTTWYGRENYFLWCIIFPIFLDLLFLSKVLTIPVKKVYSMGQYYKKYHVQKHFLVIDDERGIVVVLHYSSYIVNHQKVFPYTNDTFYGADPYCKLLITSKLVCIQFIA